jgi:hypothetical protein
LTKKAKLAAFLLNHKVDAVVESVEEEPMDAVVEEKAVEKIVEKKSIFDDEASSSEDDQEEKKPLFSFSLDDSSRRESSRRETSRRDSSPRRDTSPRRKRAKHDSSPPPSSSVLENDSDTKIEDVKVEEEEYDPLDAFMNDINTEAEQLVIDATVADTAGDSALDKEGLFVGAPNDFEDEPAIVTAEQDLMQVAASVLSMQQDVRKDVIAVDHDSMNYEEFRYTPSCL